MKISCIILLLTAVTLFAAEKSSQINLLLDPPFRAVYMNGEVTALQNWKVFDGNRWAYNRDKRTKGGLMDGRDFFKLFCRDGVFSIDFKDSKVLPYYKYRRMFTMMPVFTFLPEIPADRYRAKGSFKLNQGIFYAAGRKQFKGTGKWENFNYTFKPSSYLSISLRPVPGLHFSMKDFSVTPEYKCGIGGSIALPGNGKLTALVVSKNAPYLAKRFVYAWRGHLWKMTGTALPVYERSSLTPEKGSLVFMPGTMTRGYDFTLNKNGGTLRYYTPADINSALCNYLRKYTYIRFDRNHATAYPAKDPKRVLLAENVKVRPRYRIHAGGYHYTVYEQGTVRVHDHIAGETNWYAAAQYGVYHCSNQLLPPVAYRKKHPESQMMYADGRRQTVDSFKSLFSPCLTHKPTRQYMIDRICDTVKAQKANKPIFSFALGDLPDLFCRCPSCKAQNDDKTGKSYASVFFDFLNEAAFRLKKLYPEVTVESCAYHTYTRPPANRKVSDNFKVEHCLTGGEKPCNVHVHCAMNNAGVWKENLQGWLKLLKRRDRISLSFYDSHNPYTLIDLLNYLNQYSSERIHFYPGTTIEAYVASRWNQGDDPEKIVPEYNNGLFGADAGKYVTQIYRLCYEYDKKYKHYDGEFAGNPKRMRYLENIDRKTLSKVYALFNKAEKVIRARKGNVEPLLYLKVGFMTVDFRKYPRSGCETDAQLKAFALRVAEFVRIAKILSKSPKYPYYTVNTHLTDWSIPPRRFLQNNCGMQIPSTKKYWVDEPAVHKFMRDPVKEMVGSPEKHNGHWRFPYMILRGGQGGRILRRTSSGMGRITAILHLEEDIRGSALLSVAGWDDDKKGRATFKILVNNIEIYSGSNTFPETPSLAIAPSYMAFPVPAGLLKKGENRIVLINTVKDDPKRVIRQLINRSKPEDGYTLKQDYLWGWLAVSELRLTTPDHEFHKYSHGAKKSAWGTFIEARPVAKVTRSNGKVSIRPAGGRVSGITVPIRDNFWIVPKGVKFKMRIRVKGSGILSAGLLCYATDAKGTRLNRRVEYSVPRFKLNGKEQVFEKIVEQKVFGYACPYVVVGKNYWADISEFSLTPVK